MLSTTLRRVLATSGIAVATSLMTALSASASTTANSSAYFTGTIAPSCAIDADFTGKSSGSANSYTPTPYTSSGGVSKLETSDTITFNCNSDAVTVTGTVTPTPPTAPQNATALVGVHTALITSTVDNTQNATKTGSGAPTFATPWKTDAQGNIGITVKSTWNPQSGGQELFTGTYTAQVDITVTPN